MIDYAVASLFSQDIVPQLIADITARAEPLAPTCTPHLVTMVSGLMRKLNGEYGRTCPYRLVSTTFLPGPFVVHLCLAAQHTTLASYCRGHPETLVLRLICANQCRAGNKAS